MPGLQEMGQPAGLTVLGGFWGTSSSSDADAMRGQEFASAVLSRTRLELENLNTYKDDWIQGEESRS